MGGDFLKRFLPQSEIWISSPTWENHRAVFESAGYKVNEYPYYDPETRGLAFGKMTAALRQLPAQSIVLLHACCHNPTGADLDRGQWQELVALFKQQNLIPFIDLAYQGFAEGIEPDAFAVRTFAESGLPVVISSSFSKSFSLYRERVGAVTLVTASADEAKRAASQLKRVIRTSYSNPSSHGAQVVAMILSDKELRASWEAELTEMRERILRMRSLFVQKLAGKQQARDFSFIEKQRGMFSYSGLDLPRVQRLRTEFGIYVVDSGRMCVAAMNDGNIDYITDAIAKVL
jgi:aromatic-amino-acid transaminase